MYYDAVVIGRWTMDDGVGDDEGDDGDAEDD